MSVGSDTVRIDAQPQVFEMYGADRQVKEANHGTEIVPIDSAVKSLAAKVAFIKSNCKHVDRPQSYILVCLLVMNSTVAALSSVEL